VYRGLVVKGRDRGTDLKRMGDTGSERTDLAAGLNPSLAANMAGSGSSRGMEVCSARLEEGGRGVRKREGEESAGGDAEVQIARSSGCLQVLSLVAK